MPNDIRLCRTWSEFKESLSALFDGGAVSRGKFYFRGHGNESWPLMSAFDRWHKSSPRDVDKVEAAQRFLSLFREEAARLTPDPAVSADQEQLLSLAQHYGVPTRLLDWTESPYIAAFFAFSGLVHSSALDHRIAIWCLDTTHRLWKEDTGIKLLSIASPYNERLKNQLGKFTLLQSPFDTVEDHIAHCDKTGKALRKFVLPATEARAALSDLDFMGINYSTIYPGLEGCAGAARLRVLLEQPFQKPVP